MGRAYCGSRISPNIVRDNAGFLICTAPICRSGWQLYTRGELGLDGDGMVRVFRPVKEVTSPATIASAEGKPVAGVGHPSQFVGPNNATWIVKGHMQQVRVGKPDRNGDIPLVADLHVHDGALIEQIQRGVRDTSCGYTFDLAEGPEPGTLSMKNIRMNHVAVVHEGRAQTTRIVDAAMKGKTMNDDLDKKLDALLNRLEKYLAEHTDDDGLEDDVGLIPVEALPSADLPQNPIPGADTALKHLLALRATVIASGDARAIDAFNRAYVNTRGLAAPNAMSRAGTVSDGVDVQAEIAKDFEHLASEYHGKAIKLGRRPVRETNNRRASDNRAEQLNPAQQFERAARRARDKALG